MQTAPRAANAGSGTAPHQAARKTAGDNPKTAHYSSRRSCNAFLRTPVQHIFPQYVTHGGDENLTTRENYEYLRDSYFRYACLLDAIPKHSPGNSYGEGIANLYTEMCALVEPTLRVNIESPDFTSLSFALWHTHNWNCYNLYWLPVRFIERLRPKFRRLVITFLHELMRSNRLSDISASDEAEYVFNWMYENIDNDGSDREHKELARNLTSYESGRARRLLRRIEQRSYCKNLPRALDSFVAQDAAERTLLDIMRDGLQFIGDDKPAIINYDYDPEYQEYPDCEPVSLDIQVGLIYTVNDLFADNMIGYIESTWQESYAIEPTSMCYISPSTKQLFIPDDYPDRFFRWLERLIGFIRTNYE